MKANKNKIGINLSKKDSFIIISFSFNFVFFTIAVNGKALAKGGFICTNVQHITNVDRNPNLQI